MQTTINAIKKEDAGRGKRRRAAARRHYISGAFTRLGEPLRKLLPVFLLCLVLPTAVLTQSKPPDASPAAQKQQENPLSAWSRRGQGQMKDWLLRSAEKMPAENYGFKPTDAVRSYGQIIGHIADTQYRFCANVLGEKNPAPQIEKTKTSKAELIAALKDSFAYCDKAYGDMTDATAAQTVKHFGTDVPKMFLLNINIAHTALHYGNLITYMRLKNIVPPSSER